MAGVQDYVQWKSKQREDDRVDFPIDIPTLNLEITVIVDADLYRKTAVTEFNKKEVPNLKVELRNRELARFEADVLGRDIFNRMDSPILGKSSFEAQRMQKRTPDPEARMQKGLNELQARIEFLADSKTKTGPVVTSKEKAALREALKLPESFLYYKLGWPSPYFGVEVGIQWEKPEEPD